MLEFFFIATTFYVGPFWIAMLFSPKTEKTKKLLDKSYFFLGPILIWLVIMLLYPGNLADFSKSFNSEEGFLLGLVNAMSSKSGITATWAHMVAGDIFATRWIWKKCLKNNCHIWIIRFSVFFGVMLMPVGIFIYYIFSKTNSKS